MFGMGTWEILVIFLFILIMFGSKRLPEIARGIAKGINEFKKAANELKDDLDLKNIDKDLKG
ncbi:twin-arginine translocase TatA/TatE family subunit [candidate division KSB1 bacterium]|nr:twin-arginine translocase TatA/TatE family subunit [candidate division KSB1 bacterium]